MLTAQPEDAEGSTEEEKQDSTPAKKLSREPVPPGRSKSYNREEFTKGLRKQAIIKMSDALHVDRRVGSFNRWYHSKCRNLERLILRSFELGVAFMFLDITTYVMAHLENGDDGETHSTRAWKIFVSTTAVLLVASFVLPEVFGGDVPYSVWHDGIFGTQRNWKNVRSGICVEELNPYDVLEKAEKIFNAMDPERTGKLTLDNVAKAVYATGQCGEDGASLKRLRDFLPTFGITPSGRSYTDDEKRYLCHLLKDDELLQDVVLNAMQKLASSESTQQKQLDKNESFLSKNEWIRELRNALF